MKVATLLMPSSLFFWAEVMVVWVKRQRLSLVLGVMPRLTLLPWVTGDMVPCIMGSLFVSLLLRNWTLEWKQN